MTNTTSTDTTMASALGAAEVEATVLLGAEELLGTATTPTDNFFALGGNSLLAARFTALLLKRLDGIEVSLNDVFEAPVLKDLIARLRSRAATPSGQAQAPSAQEPAMEQLAATDEHRTKVPAVQATVLGLPGQAIPLTYSQKRRRVRDVSSSGDRIPHNISAVFDLSGPVDTTALRLACLDLVHRHASLRTLFLSDEERHHASFVDPAELYLDDLFRIVPAYSHSPQELDGLTEAEATRLFDLARDVKLRVTLFQRGETTARLVVTTEHLVADGESFKLLLGDLSTAYTARQTGAEPDLGWPDARGRAWGEIEHRLNHERLAANLDYWRSNLDPLEALPEVRLAGMHEPTSRPTGAAQAVTTISAELVQRLRQWCAENGCGLYSGFLSALALSVLANNGSSVVGVVGPTSVRPEGWEREVAWFSTLSIFRFRINSELAMSEVLRAARATVLGGISHALPLPLLVDHLQPGRDTVQLWRPWLYLDVQEVSGQPALQLTDVQVAEADAELMPALRPGVSIGIVVGPQSTSVLLQYEVEAWSAPLAEAFSASLATSVELLVEGGVTLEGLRTLRERHGFA
ncbi:condensation domain-containing protein [Streptomyces sp. NPDC006465]|uniref:condensation domain-containing protein n=1 Tax=Streptomyces sp. NPDC006465 TaxID=3157174 RepID=UPI0033B5026F